jgi:MFS family permease
MQEVPALRPLSVGDIIDRTIRLYRTNFVLLFVVAALPTLIVEVLQRAFGLTQTFDLGDFTSALNTPGGTVILPRQLQPANPIAAFVVGLLSFALFIVQFGALIHLVGQRYLGRPASIREGFSEGLRAAPRLFLAGLLVVAVIAIVFLVLVVGVAALNSQAFAALAVIIGLIGFFILFPFMLMSLAVLGPAVVLEGLGPIAAIRRSFHLMERARWRAFGLYILMGIISSLLGLIFTVLFFVSFVSEPTIRAVLQGVASIASAAVSYPLLYGSLAILYYDLRVRKEAFDLQLAAEALPRDV